MGRREERPVIVDRDRTSREDTPEQTPRERAQELADQGIPFQMAMAVAHGRLTLNDALERLAQQDRVEQLMRTHDLSRALATQVAMGHADLDKLLRRRRMEAHREENRLRSILDEHTASGEPLALALHGHRRTAR